MSSPPRPPTVEESLALGIVQRNQGPFVLVPVLWRGETRYALAAQRDVAGEVKLQVLALCMNLEQDMGHIVSLNGTVAHPFRALSKDSTETT